MARIPTSQSNVAPVFRGVRSSTIHTNKTGGVNPQTGKQPPVLGTSAPLQKAGGTFVTADDLKDPARLLKVIRDLQAQIDRMTVGARSNPHSTPCIVRNVTTHTSTTLIIPHTLGRPFTGYWVCAQAPNSPQWAGVRVDKSVYPGGLTEALALVLLPNVTGTYDFCITGD